MHCSSRHYDHSDQDMAERKFRKSLRAFLGFNFVVFIFMLFGSASGLWKVSIIWGAILAIKGKRLFNKDRDDYNRPDPHDREQYGRPKRPNWKKKDLV